MKLYVFSIIFCFQFLKTTFSQIFSSDSVNNNRIQLINTNVAVEINSGAIKYFYDDKTGNFIGDHWGQSFKVKLYYKDIFVGSCFYPSSFRNKDTLNFSGKLFYRNSAFTILKINIMAGYNITLPRNFNIETYIGYLNSSFIESNQNFVSKFSNGYIIGFTINKYFEIKENKFVNIYVNNSFNKSNFGNLSSNLGNKFYLIEIGLGYKFEIIKHQPK